MENQNKTFKIREEEFFDKYCEYVNRNRVDNLVSYVVNRRNNVAEHEQNNYIKKNDCGYNYFKGMKKAFEEVLDVLKIFWIEEVEVNPNDEVIEEKGAQ